MRDCKDALITCNCENGCKSNLSWYEGYRLVLYSVLDKPVMSVKLAYMYCKYGNPQNRYHFNFQFPIDKAVTVTKESEQMPEMCYFFVVDLIQYYLL